MKQEEEQIKEPVPAAEAAEKEPSSAARAIVPAMSFEAFAPYTGDDFYSEKNGTSQQCYSCGCAHPVLLILWTCSGCSYQECERCRVHCLCGGSYWDVLPI